MRDKQNWVLAAALVAVSLLVVGIWVKPSVEERLAPEPVRAWVAIQLAGADVAEIGRIEIEADQEFTLHAVLEAQDRRGRSVYYTDAERLRFSTATTADEPPSAIADGMVRRWDRAPHVKVRWFTVEGSRPYLGPDDQAAIEAFGFETYYRSQWPNTWAIAGEVDAAFDDHLAAALRPLSRKRFGTARYHVRIELYADEMSTLPLQRVVSPGPEALPSGVATFPTVVASLPGALAAASRVFGLTQLDLPVDASARAREAVRAWADAGLAFSRLTVVRDQLHAAGVSFGEEVWRSIDLGVANRWGEAVGSGDLLRVGERIVTLYRDEGEIGVLDYEDLCFDFVRGAEVRALGEIFSGEGMVVEIQRLSSG